MFKKILVPLDRSELAERALQPARTLAEQAGGSLILFHVPPPVLVKAPDMVKDMTYGHYYADWDKGHEDGLEYLAGIKYGRFPANFPVKTELGEGEAADAILNFAAANGVDLIIMSTHGRSGLSRWFYGSVTEKVLSSAPCPVLAVRSAAPIRHVMIPLDGSKLSETAVLPGLATAQHLGATVTLFEAAPIAPAVKQNVVAQLEKYEHGLGTHLIEDPLETTKGYLDMMARTYKTDDLVITTAVAREPAAEAILNFADDAYVDLIVMATHGRTGLNRWVYGSVTEKVLRHTSDNLLIVRSI